MVGMGAGAMGDGGRVLGRSAGIRMLMAVGLGAIAALALAWIVTLAIGGGGAIGVWWAVLLGALGAGVGVAFASTRSDVQDGAGRAIESEYEEVHRDLLDARRIHEGAFPEPIREGTVQFTYQYLPMRQIGGDYLHAFRGAGAGGAEASLSIALLDVTGHGVAAALTVNRLHGELTRLYAEHPDMRPIDALKALNKYVYLTLADHSIFVTGIIVRADPRDNTLEYASAGHPPAFLRTSAGVTRELGSTAMVLGALPADEYDVDEAVMRFGPGDSVVAYTDGVIEAREPGGEMLGLGGLRSVFESGWADRDGRWPATIVREVERFRRGEADDDTLVVELFRTMGGGVVVGSGGSAPPSAG